MSLKSILCILSFTFGGVIVPTMACAAPPPAESFGVLPAVYDAAISPNGNEIATIVNIKGGYFVRITDLNNPNAKPSLVKLSKGVKPLWVKWANDTQVLTGFWQSEELSGTRLTTGHIYTFNTRTYKGRVLVTPPQGILRQYNNRVVDWLENDPNHILMTYSDRSQLHSPDLWKVNVVTGKDKLVKRGFRRMQSWVTDQGGNPRVNFGQKDDSEGTKIMKIRDANDEVWKDVSEYSGLTAETKIFGFTSNPNRMIIGSYQNKDTLGLYVYNLETKTLGRKIYHNDNFDVSGIVVSANGEDIIGAQYIADTEETVLLGGNGGLLHRLREENEGFQVDYIDQSQNGDTLLAKVSNAYHPGRLIVLKTGAEPVSLGQYYPGLDPNEMGLVISIKYTARDGQKIPAYVTIPSAVTSTADLKKIPFIVLPHGGPYARDDKRFDYFAQFFATRGYGVLQMNFRGSEGYGKTYEDAGRKNWVVMQEDVEDGARFLLEKGYADPNRICIAGWSFGGYAALMGAAKQGDLYKCSISMAGLTDIPAYISTQNRYQYGKSSAKSFILDGFESRDDIKENSPVKLAEDIKIPLFLAHGEDDQRVYYRQYKRMKTALRKSSSDVTYMSFKEEDHFLSNQKHRVNFFKGLEKFLIKVNGTSEYAR